SGAGCFRGSDYGDQFLEHGGRARDEGKLALVRFQVQYRVRDVPGQPLTVGGRDHQVLLALPDEDARGDLLDGESPRPDERQVVVEPAVDARPQSFGALSGQVLDRKST